MSSNSLCVPRHGSRDHAQSLNEVRSPNRWATGDDWILQRPLIQRLYLKEGKPLPEVMRIMETRHGFRATTKMYKRRITQWGWQKRKRHAHTTATRRDEDSQSSLTETDSSSRAQSEEPKNPAVDATVTDTQARIDVASDVPTTEMRALQLTPQAPFMAAIPFSLEDPRVFKGPAILLQTIRDYVLGSLEAGKFVISNEHTRLISCITSSKPDGNHLLNLKEIFFRHHAACSLIDQGSYSEARKVLDEGMAGVNKIVLAEHPETIGTILTLVLYLRARNRPEISRLLLTQLANIARVYHNKGHPLIRVCQVFMSLDPRQCDHLMWLFHTLTHNIFQSIGTKCNYCYRPRDNLSRALAMVNSDIFGRHTPANPVGSRSEWSSLLNKSLLYKGKFDMAGRIALLFLSDHCGGCSLDRLSRCEDDKPYPTANRH